MVLQKTQKGPHDDNASAAVIVGAFSCCSRRSVGDSVAGVVADGADETARAHLVVGGAGEHLPAVADLHHVIGGGDLPGDVGAETDLHSTHDRRCHTEGHGNCGMQVGEDG